MNRFFKAALLATGLLSLNCGPATAQEIEYRTPSKEVKEMILSKALPVLTFNAQMTYAVSAEADGMYRPLSYIASINEYKVAGLRLDGDNFSQTRKAVYDAASIVCVADGTRKPVSGLPKGALLSSFKWSPDGRWLCFLNNAAKEVELYRVDAFSADLKARKINTRPVNSIFGNAFCFISDSVILYRSVPASIGAFPKGGGVQSRPVMLESNGAKYNYETYQDLIKSKYDEEVFEYLCTSELSLFDGSKTATVGTKGIIRSFSVSPDGKYVIVKNIKRPYSYSKPYSEFPQETAVIGIDGTKVKVLGKTNGEVTRSGWDWRKDRPSTLFWFENRKGKDTGFRTSVCQCDAPFDVDGKDIQVILTPEYDINSIIWGTEDVALYTDRSNTAKLRRTYSFNPSDTAAPHVLLRSESTYNLRPDISSFVGDFVLERTDGTVKMDRKHSFVLMTGCNRLDADGAKYWFVDKISLKDGKVTNIWNAKAPFKTAVLGVTHASDKGIRFIGRKESPTYMPNYVEISVDKKGNVNERTFTSYESVVPHLDRIREEYITYKRSDGINCAARVYLPADWKKDRDGALPMFLWTYPYEHFTKESAEMNFRADKYRYAIPDQFNQFFWCLKGYAVVLEWTQAIVAENKDADYNKHFVMELKKSAQGIVDALVAAGIGDRDRVAVGGLSYGSFMTANLLAHTNMFKCGFANSGAFNRTLTPFGFQWYEKTYWESSQIYNEMSPFNYADKIKTPILLTHGMMDENTGTYPIQSERLYYAVAGNGGDARWLQLPYEGHKMAFTENVLHYFSVVEEMLDKYVTNAGAGQKTNE